MTGTVLRRSVGDEVGDGRAASWQGVDSNADEDELDNVLKFS